MSDSTVRQLARIGHPLLPLSGRMNLSLPPPPPSSLSLDGLFSPGASPPLRQCLHRPVHARMTAPARVCVRARMTATRRAQGGKGAAAAGRVGHLPHHQADHGAPGAVCAVCGQVMCVRYAVCVCKQIMERQVMYRLRLWARPGALAPLCTCTAHLEALYTCTGPPSAGLPPHVWGAGLRRGR
jgi:hypothetical protein